MDPQTGHLIELTPDRPLPKGYERLPEDLNPAAEKITQWAKDRRRHLRKAKAKRRKLRKAKKARKSDG